MRAEPTVPRPLVRVRSVRGLALQLAFNQLHRGGHRELRDARDHAAHIELAKVWPMGVCETMESFTSSQADSRLSLIGFHHGTFQNGVNNSDNSTCASTEHHTRGTDRNHFSKFEETRNHKSTGEHLGNPLSGLLRSMLPNPVLLAPM